MFSPGRWWWQRGDYRGSGCATRNRAGQETRLEALMIKATQNTKYITCLICRISTNAAVVATVYMPPLMLALVILNFGKRGNSNCLALHPANAYSLSKYHVSPLSFVPVLLSVSIRFSRLHCISSRQHASCVSASGLNFSPISRP